MDAQDPSVVLTQTSVQMTLLATSRASSCPLLSDDAGPREAETHQRAALEDCQAVVAGNADGRKLRKSCDRCHQQKLRCNRDKRRPTHCLRCQRAGAECVYSVRENKQSAKTSKREATGDNARSSLAQDDFGVTFDPQLLTFDHFFDNQACLAPFWPSGPDTTEALGTAIINNYLIPTPQSMPFSSGSTAPGLGLGASDGPSDLSTLLATIYHDLEASYTKMLRHQTNQTTQDCMTTT